MPLHQMDAGHVLELEDFAERALAITAGAPSPRVGMMQWSFSSLIAEGRALGCRNIMLGNGGDELFNVDPSYAQDLLRAGDLRALYQLTRARQRTSPLSGPAAARHVLWSCGLRPILRSSARRAIPEPALDLARRWLGRDRWFLAPDPELGQAMTRRAAPEPEPGKVYESSMRGAVNTASLLHDVDQTSAWAERHKVSLLYPYYDRDLVSLALRCPPAMLYRTGQMKSPLRGLVDRELSQVWLPGRKVDFTGEANRCLRPSLRHLWRRLGGAKRLEELNIVSPDRIEQWIDGYIHGRAGGLRHVWSIFAAEVWLRGAR
jgi:hypothetical protein